MAHIADHILVSGRDKWGSASPAQIPRGPTSALQVPLGLLIGQLITVPWGEWPSLPIPGMAEIWGAR